MNVQVPKSMDSTTFLTWSEGREGRYELTKGRVLMMTGGSRGHALVVRRLANALEKQLDEARWAVLTSDFATKIKADTVRYPDIIVDVANAPLRDLAAVSPALIAEVLSPSSVATDLGDKASEYLNIDSLLAYLVLSQDEAKVWLWVRDQSLFPAGALVIEGFDGIIRIPALSIELPLSEIYKGFPPSGGEA